MLPPCPRVYGQLGPLTIALHRPSSALPSSLQLRFELAQRERVLAVARACSVREEKWGTVPASMGSYFQKQQEDTGHF